MEGHPPADPDTTADFVQSLGCEDADLVPSRRHLQSDGFDGKIAESERERRSNMVDIRACQDRSRKVQTRPSKMVLTTPLDLLREAIAGERRQHPVRSRRTHLETSRNLADAQRLRLGAKEHEDFEYLINR
jgi:hypothetical protein